MYSADQILSLDRLPSPWSKIMNMVRKGIWLPGVRLSAGIVLIFLFPNCFIFAQGLEIKNQGTKLAYIARNGKPVLAFGCHLEHMFLKDNHPDYTVWSDWAQVHGVNHCRVRVVQPMIGDRYKPYQPAGGSNYDLTRFDPAFWNRFRTICMNLRDHGIIVHLLMFPHNGHVRSSNWRKSLFNPDHNVNAATDHLSAADHYKFWKSVADKQAGLWKIQRAAVEKIVEQTADLDNVYYDLSHEFRTDCCGAQPTDWNKAKQFFEAVAETLRTKYAELQPGKTPLIGLDAEHFAKAGQRDWNFSSTALNLMILGNSSESPVPSVDTVISWREKYGKPFLLQEGGADDDAGGKIAISYHDTNHTVIRKYVWKWFMAKNQLIDFYQKKREPPRYPDDYDPHGHNAFENDALVLRQFWNTLTDYGNLGYVGGVSSGPGFRKMVLSSRKEAIAYMASKMDQVGTRYDAQDMSLTGLALASGAYTVDVWDPDASGRLLQTQKKNVRGGSVTISLPPFTDDLAVHLYQDAANLPAKPRSSIPSDRVRRLWSELHESR